ncbi:MAG: hypothetical protein K1X83_07520 [Oligoflexia bacterium]|nr:hypothetical protein [Oligoflexia bacterium]
MSLDSSYAGTRRSRNEGASQQDVAGTRQPLFERPTAAGELARNTQLALDCITGRLAEGHFSGHLSRRNLSRAMRTGDWSGPVEWLSLDLNTLKVSFRRRDVLEAVAERFREIGWRAELDYVDSMPARIKMSLFPPSKRWILEVGKAFRQLNSEASE